MSRNICMISIQPMLFDSRIQNEARCLRDAGHSVTIVYVEDVAALTALPDIDGLWHKYYESMQGITTIGITLASRGWKVLPKSLNKLFQAFELTGKLLWSAVVKQKNVDVYHCHDLQPGIFCIIGKLLRNADLVYDAHELEVRAPHRIGRMVQRLHETLVMTFCKKAIAASEYYASVMEEYYEREVSTVLNMPEYLPAENVETDLLRSELELPEQCHILMYVGYVARYRRGIEETVAALAHVEQDVYLLLMAIGRLAEFKRHIHEYAVSVSVDPKRIIFIGPYTTPEIIQYLSGADISIMLIHSDISTSYDLSTPNKLFQSFMARTPILASNTKSLARYVTNNSFGPAGEVVQDSRDPLQIAEKIEQMLQSTQQAVYRENAEQLARIYCWEKEADRLTQIYEEIEHD